MSRGWVYLGWLCKRVCLEWVDMSGGWALTPPRHGTSGGTHTIPQTWDTMGYGRQTGSTHPI